jgi:hypothetical protein
MIKYNIVTNQKIIDHFKKSNYWKKNLGLVSTIEKNGDRVYNERDTFHYFYNTLYKTTIYCQGSIGDIMFYLDYYIRQDKIAMYLNKEEFIFDFEEGIMLEKGPNFYMGKILKEIEEENQDRIEKASGEKIEIKKEPIPEKVFSSPGAVTYDDIQAYLKKKSENRLNID